MPIEIHHLNFEIGKMEKLPHLFFFFKEQRERYKEGDEVKKRRKGTRETVSLAGAAIKCSAVGQKGPRVIIDPPSVPDSPCPGA